MDDSLSSLRKQLAEAEGNLRLIEERMSEYVRKVDIPLQDIKEKRRLEKQIADLEARLAQLMAGPCPYRGLEPFEAEHAEFYFGREAMVERLVEKVGECPFVAVVGSSGCGKSSLVRAGLVTALQEGALPGSQGWAVRLFRPGADPLRALSMPLVALLEPEATEVTRLAEARKLADHLCHGTLAAADVAARLREKRPDLPRLVLAADQFEELYTECGDETLRQAFVEALLAAAAEEGVAVVLTLRADFYGRVLADRQLGEAVDAGLVNVLPMSEEELRAAIEKPALKAGREFEPGLVRSIVEDVAGEPGDLPLLEFALTELWARQTAEGAFTHAAYGAVGRVEGAISRRAEAVYEELEEEGQAETVQRIFLRLTHYGEGAEGTRRRATLTDLVTPRTPREEIEPVVKALADARLLVTGQDDAPGTATAEVAHEALIWGWKRLRDWLKDDRDFGRWRERLAAAMEMGILLRNASLAKAEGWLRERGDDLNKVERGFIQASIYRQEQERVARERLRRRITFGLAAGLLVALFLASMFLWQRNEASHARATSEVRRQDAEAAQASAVAESNVAAIAQAEAEKQRDEARRQSQISLAESLAALAPHTDNDNELTALLAIEALNLVGESPGPAGWLIDRALREVLSQPYFNTTLRGHEYGVYSVAFSPDGRWLASGSGDDTVRLWDMEDTSAEPRVLSGHEGGVLSVAFSPDGQWLASGSGDDTVRLWEVADPAAARVLTGHEASVSSVAFSADGQWLASGGDDTVRLWDVADPSAAPRVLSGHESMVNSVAFSPDGRWLASGSWDYTTVRLWDVADPSAAPRVLSGHESLVRSVAFSPDGRWLASGSWDDTVRLWEVEDPSAAPRVLSGHEDWVTSVAFSPDGRWLASGSYDRTVRLWDVEDPSAAPRVLSGHEDWVWSVAFSPDGRWLASGGADRTVRLWDMADPSAAPRVLSGHEYKVTSVAFSPDGRWLASGSYDSTLSYDSTMGLWMASGSEDGTLRLWMATLEELAGLGCQKVRRNLTLEEWQQYLGAEPYRKTCPNLPGPKGWDETLQATPTATAHSFVSPLPTPTESLLPFDSPLPTPGP